MIVQRCNDVKQKELILFKIKLYICSVRSAFSVLLLDKGDNEIEDKEKKRKKAYLDLFVNIL